MLRALGSITLGLSTFREAAELNALCRLPAATVTGGVVPEGHVPGRSDLARRVGTGTRRWALGVGVPEEERGVRELPTSLGSASGTPKVKLDPVTSRGSEDGTDG